MSKNIRKIAEIYTSPYDKELRYYTLGFTNACICRLGIISKLRIKEARLERN